MKEERKADALVGGLEFPEVDALAESPNNAALLVKSTIGSSFFFAVVPFFINESKSLRSSSSNMDFRDGLGDALLGTEGEG